MKNQIAMEQLHGHPDKVMSVQELKDLASQLGKPEGEKGIQIGQMMNETNNTMIQKTVEHLSLRDNDRILELGHGNGNHLQELFSCANNLEYSGIDISELMMQEAEKYSIENKLDKRANFLLYDGTNIPFADNSFDKIFSVNTIYFWQHPVQLLNELNRVLKPDGIFCITLVDEESMSQLPFTEYGFTKYTDNLFKALVRQTSLKIAVMKPFSEMIKSKLLGEMERKFWIMELSKGA